MLSIHEFTASKTAQLTFTNTKFFHEGPYMTLSTFWTMALDITLKYMI